MDERSQDRSPTSPGVVPVSPCNGPARAGPPGGIGPPGTGHKIESDVKRPGAWLLPDSAGPPVRASRAGSAMEQPPPERTRWEPAHRLNAGDGQRLMGEKASLMSVVRSALLCLAVCLGLPSTGAWGLHRDTTMAAHTPVRTLITADSATFRHTWRLASTGQLFGDSRSAYSNKAYDTVGLLSDVEVSVNLETAFIRPTDSYVYIKHIYNYGNGYDTYRVRGDSSLNFVVGVYVDMDADSQYDALDPPADILIVKDFTETVVLVVAQAGPTALDGSVDTLY